MQIQNPKFIQILYDFFVFLQHEKKGTQSSEFCICHAHNTGINLLCVSLNAYWGTERHNSAQSQQVGSRQ